MRSMMWRIPRGLLFVAAFVFAFLMCSDAVSAADCPGGVCNITQASYTARQTYAGPVQVASCGASCSTSGKVRGVVRGFHLLPRRCR